MSESVATGVSVLDVLAGLERVEDQLAAVPLERCSDDEIVEVLRRREISRRRAAVLDQRLIEQVHRRSIFFAKGCATVVVFLRMLLRITPGEAAARFRASRLLGPQRNVQGEPTAAIFPAVSAAQQAGEMSAAHAAVVVDMITKLPHEVAAVMDRTVETLLVDFAREHDPLQLRHHAEDLRNYLDQDGQYKDAAYRDRVRDARLRDNPDGSGHLDGELTAECAERLRVLFDTLAKPKPAEDGTPDPRTPGQRRHDALLEWLRLVEQAGLLPKAGGVTATLILTMDIDDFGTGDGVARTGHGFAVPVDLAKRWAGPEARAIAVLLSKTKGIEAYSSIQRIFTQQQRLAMMARDGGCSFPHCDACLAWTDAHHVTDWKTTHHTRVDDGTLACSKNHDTFERMGFTSVMLNGRPHWVPPKWIDPAQKPIRNTMHDH